MSHNWESTCLTSVQQVLEVLAELKGKQWLCRGQSKLYDTLTPTIDRKCLAGLSRARKLSLERQAIDLFRSTARFFGSQGEKEAINNDITTLMVLRHYEVPTRLLDWSLSPYVACYFAVNDKHDEDGEIWSFDEREYAEKGKKQWTCWPQTTRDGIFDAKLTAFMVEEPPNWFVCQFYRGFPRQEAQDGAFSMTARFDRDHADAIAELLKDQSRSQLSMIRRYNKDRIA